jgi:hypothetical protein
MRGKEDRAVDAIVDPIERRRAQARERSKRYREKKNHRSVTLPDASVTENVTLRDADNVTHDESDLPPLDPEDMIGFANLDGADGDLAIWANERGEIVIVWDRKGWSHQREHLILDLATASRLVTRVREIAGAVTSTIQRELAEASEARALLGTEASS